MIKNTFLFICFCLITLTAKANDSETEVITIAGNVSYSIGGKEYTKVLSRLSITIKTEKFGDVGKERSNSSFTLTINDTENARAIRIHVKDDNVVEKFVGSYPLRAGMGIEEGKSLTSTSIMIIDTNNASNILSAEPGGSCTIDFVASAINIFVKDAIVRDNQGNDVAFSLTLTMKDVKVTKKP
jgi:hypothetical protein